MFGIDAVDLLIILVLAVVLFGPEKLPQYSRKAARIFVYLRDIAHSTGLLAVVLSFVSPVFYPTSTLPAPYSQWIYLNPLTWVMETTRAVLVHGNPPHWGQWLLALSASALACWLGYWSFQKARSGFADVL